MEQKGQSQEGEQQKTPERELIERKPELLLGLLKIAYYQAQHDRYYTELSNEKEDSQTLGDLVIDMSPGNSYLGRPEATRSRIMSHLIDFLQKAGLCDPENPKCARATSKDERYDGIISDGYMYFDPEDMVDGECDIVFHFYQDKDSNGQFHLDNPHKVSEMKNLQWIDNLPY